MLFRPGSSKNFSWWRPPMMASNAGLSRRTILVFSLFTACKLAKLWQLQKLQTAEIIKRRMVFYSEVLFFWHRYLSKGYIPPSTLCCFSCQVLSFAPSSLLVFIKKLSPHCTLSIFTFIIVFLLRLRLCSDLCMNDFK